MGGFGWVGAAKGANDSLQEMLTRAFAERLEMERMQLSREAGSRADRQLEATLGLQREQSERNRRDQQLQEAAIALGQADSMGQGSELPSEIAGVLRGTPYGVRVQDKATLPSKSIEMPIDATLGQPGGPRSVGNFLMKRETSDAGGRQYATLAPTLAQQKVTGEESAFQQLLQGLAPDAGNLARLERMGVRGLNIHDVEGAAAHGAHVSRESREAEDRANRINRQSHEWAVERDRANEGRADARERAREARQLARASQFTQADFVALTRDANTRAVSEYNALVQANGGTEPVDASGNPITPQMLAQAYVDETLAALEAFDESGDVGGGAADPTGGLAAGSRDAVLPPNLRGQPAVPGAQPNGGPASGGRRLISNLRRRGQGGARPVASLTPRGAAGAAGGQTITRDELRATAQRLGITEAVAAQQAAARGLRVQ